VEWFSNFMCGIRFKDYIASFATAKVNVEDQTHPVMRELALLRDRTRGVDITIDRQANVRVLASVDENLCARQSAENGRPSVVWANEHVKARNV